MTRKRLLLLIIAIVVAFGLWYALAPSRTPAPQPPLAKLTQQNFAQFTAAFNGASQNPRLILLLSPT